MNVDKSGICNIGSRLELFVDRYIVDRMTGVSLRMHTPQMLPLPQNPICGSYMTVIRDGELYRAYYRGTIPGYEGVSGDGNPGEITCYAESCDGHEWTFPKLGIFEMNGSRDNNVILGGQCPFSHNFSPMLDTRPGTQPEERFKALAGVHRGEYARLRLAFPTDKRYQPQNGVEPGGLWAFVSSDGIHWRNLKDHPVISPEAFGLDSQNVVFWSEAEGQYVCYLRSRKETPQGKLRSISRTTSPDLIHWSEPVPTDPNLPGEHLYTSQTHPYFRAPHIYIALPTRFQPDRGSSTDILFMSSRAGGESFDRLFTEAFIRPGIDPARWGNRSNYAALNVVPTGPAEMSIYHAKSGHRYVLRTDGFISVNAGVSEGELLTKPLLFDGTGLTVNYSTSAAGSLRVELQAADGVPVPGFRLQDCRPIIGDEIERRIEWSGNPDLGILKGRPVRLLFVMQECDLYSLRFT